MKKKFLILSIIILMLISVAKAQKKEEKVSFLDYSVNLRIFKETPNGKKELIPIKHIHIGEDKYYRENIKINDDLRLKVTIDFDELLNLRIYEKNKLLFLIGSREIKKGRRKNASYFEFRFKHKTNLYLLEVGSHMAGPGLGIVGGGVLGSGSYKKNKNKKDKKK
jgi:hypothetical protein